MTTLILFTLIILIVPQISPHKSAANGIFKAGCKLSTSTADSCVESICTEMSLVFSILLDEVSQDLADPKNIQWKIVPWLKTWETSKRKAIKHIEKTLHETDIELYGLLSGDINDKMVRPVIDMFKYLRIESEHLLHQVKLFLVDGVFDNVIAHCWGRNKGNHHWELTNKLKEIKKESDQMIDHSFDMYSNSIPILQECGISDKEIAKSSLKIKSNVAERKKKLRECWNNLKAFIELLDRLEH